MICPVCNHRRVTLNSPTCEYCGLVWTGEGAWKTLSNLDDDGAMALDPFAGFKESLAEFDWAGTIFCDCGRGACRTPAECEGIESCRHRRVEVA